MTRRAPAIGRLARLWWIATVLGALALGGMLGRAWFARSVLPSVLEVEIAEAGLPFRARLDTGAQVSSINAIDVAVDGGDGRPSRHDLGRTVHFTLVNERGARAHLSAPIAGVYAIRTADCQEYRYHVLLTVRYRGRAHQVLTNLNDRRGAAETLLLGRNWLQNGYLVDVGQ
jgi:hypothetical protein